MSTKDLTTTGLPTLEQVLHDSRSHPFFLEFLQKRQADALLMFWNDCENFKQLMGKTQEIASQAKKIIDIHFGTHMKTATLLGEVENKRVLDEFRKGKPTLDMFASAQRECVRQLRASHFPGFLESKSYKEMLQAPVDIKTWTVSDVFRDPKRTRALHLLLQVERPDFVETLRFALDLRDRYTPLVAEGLLPITEGPTVHANKVATQSKVTQKLNIAKELIDLGKFLEKKYLSAESKQFAKGVSGPTAARVRTSLEEGASRLEAATVAANHNLSVAAANQANLATRWVRGGAIGQPSPAQSAAPVGPSAAVIEDTIKFLADAFKQAEAEAFGWLDKFAMADARRIDYFLTPINEPALSTRGPLIEDVPSPDAILVLRLTSADVNWRLQGPHRIGDRDETARKNNGTTLTHALMLGTKHVQAKSKEEISLFAVDVTGATVSGTSKGLKFRTCMEKVFTFPEIDDSGLQRASSSAVSTGVEEDAVIQQTAKVTSLAGVSQQESVAENSARSKSQISFDSRSLANTELHAHCFPLNLVLEVDPIAFANEPESLVFVHYFCLPCKSTRHSFEFGCTCLYGACMTRVAKKKILVPIENTANTNLAELSTLSVDSSSGSFSISRGRGKSPRNQHYSETALALQKVPNFGLGLNLALNRDGSVVVTRFVSDVQTPSPAAASGKIAVEDELLSVNRVSVHGRRFDDIVNQIKNAINPVNLRFARGSYYEAVLAKASSLSAESDRIVEIKNSDGEGSEEFLKFTVLGPEVACLTSTEPTFEEMRAALETAWGGRFSLDEGETVEARASKALLGMQAKRTLSWRVDLELSLFAFLDVSDVIDIASALLMERRILIVSDYPDRIAPAVIAMMQIIRPFSWRHDFSALLPESHYDWFASRVGAGKPFFAGVCTVDVVPPPVDQFLPKRQGRLALREDVWSTRERDFLMPFERLTKNAGYVRSALTSLTGPETVIVDLDSGQVSGNLNAVEKDRLPADVREELISSINSALGRGGIARWDEDEHYEMKIDTPQHISHTVNVAFLNAFTTLTLNRCGEFALSLRENVVGFYRAAFLGAVKNEHHQEFLERFTKTEMFKEYVTSSWDLTL